jgi:hypothetical protein
MASQAPNEIVEGDPEKNAYFDEILELIGVKRPPRKYEQEKALCCTAAIIRVFAELAQEIQAKDVDDAIQCGANALITLTLQKSRMPQIQGGEGEAVVCYCEPLTTQEMGYLRLS